MHRSVFISYNSKDWQTIQPVLAALRASGVETFLDRTHLAAGQPWPAALERALASSHAVAVFLGPHGLGNWQKRELWLALDRSASNEGFPVIPVLLPGGDPALGFLSLYTWVDFSRDVGDEAGLRALLAGIRGEPPGADATVPPAGPRPAVNPYRGLRYFREEDAPFFHGRDQVSKDLAQTIHQHRLVTLVGASGSGKSSVIRAGAVPILRRAPEGVHWEVASLRPGENPLLSLADVLASLLQPDLGRIDRLRKAEDLAETLATGKRTLRNWVEQVLELDEQKGTDRLLLIIDQAEELFTLCQDVDARRRFLDLLLAGTLAGPVHMVMGVRGDFYGHFLDYRDWADRVKPGLVNLGPMKRDELETAIVKPAERVGLQFQPGLVKHILDDVGNEPGNLPLLEFLLDQLWQRRTGQELTHEAYGEAG